MKNAVFIKQVPDTNDVKWTENNNIDRARMDSIINPVDKQAVEAALELKDNIGAYVCVISMGPDKAKSILKESIAMGCDDAVLLCSPKFAGSDTCATSRVLASFIKQKFSDVDLILFGQSAIDGETSQTGPSTAARLNLPCLSHVNKIESSNENTLKICTETEDTKCVYNAALPFVLCINNYIKPPRIPKINGYIKAHNYEIKSFNHTDLNLTDTQIGVKGSPTWVSKVFKIKEGRNGRIFEQSETEMFLEYVINTIEETVKINGK